MIVVLVTGITAALLALPLLDKRYRTASYVSRALAAALIVTALTEPAPSSRDEGIHTVFLLDLSDSVGVRQREEMVEFVVRSTEDLGRPHSAGAIAFAAGPAVALRATSSAEVVAAALAELRIPENRGRSDIGSAIDAGLALLPSSGDRRIVLLSDGLGTGDAFPAVAAATAGGVRVSTVFVPPARPDPEVRLVEVTVPDSVGREEVFTASAVYESTGETPGTVALLRNGEVEGTERVLFRQGTHAFAYQLAADGRGEHETIRFEVEAEGDRFVRNNAIERRVRGVAPAEVLYISANEPRPFGAALSAQGYRVKYVDPRNLVRDVSVFDSWRAVVIDDIPARDLSFATMSALERYVRSIGGGVVLLGGPNAFGPGAYINTPLELLLPVSADVTSRVQVPTLALLFLIDTSGSMSGSAGTVNKLDIVKEALLASLNVLRPNQMIGLLAFDAETDWVVPLRRARDREATVRDIAELRSGGGTVLASALEEAYRALSEIEAAGKHLLILSDGLTREADFPVLVANLREAMVTVSTVSVGTEADRSLMEAIAADGGGRSYHSDSLDDIPQIFAGETSLVAREAVVEEPFFPVPGEESPLLAGIDPWSTPALGGYVVTFPKTTTRIVLEAPGAAPLLAHWRYGLGRSVVMTSGLDDRWGGEWVRWSEFPRFAGQAVAFVERPPGNGGVRLSARYRDGEIALSVDVANTAGVDGGIAEATMITPDEREVSLPLVATGVGRYEATVAGETPGTYLFTIAAAERLQALGRVNVPYSLEYARMTPDPAYLERIARAGNGVSVGSGADLFPHRALPRKTTAAARARPLWPWLISAAALLFAIETVATAVRRRRRPTFRATGAP